MVRVKTRVRIRVRTRTRVRELLTHLLSNTGPTLLRTLKTLCR